QAGFAGKLAPQMIDVTRGSLGREFAVEISVGFFPGRAVPRDRKFRTGPLDVEFPSDENVRALHRPDDGSRPACLGQETVVSRLDSLHGGSLTPFRPGEVRAVFPLPVADAVGNLRRPAPVLLD